MSPGTFLIYTHFLLTKGDWKMLLCCISWLVLLIWSCISKLEKQQVIHVQTALITIRRPPSPALQKENLTKQEDLDIARAVCAYLLNMLIYHLIVSKQFHVLIVVSRAKAERSPCLLTNLKPQYKESRDGVRNNAAKISAKQKVPPKNFLQRGRWVRSLKTETTNAQKTEGQWK